MYFMAKMPWKSQEMAKIVNTDKFWMDDLYFFPGFRQSLKFFPTSGGGGAVGRNIYR